MYNSVEISFLCSWHLVTSSVYIVGSRGSDGTTSDTHQPLGIERAFRDEAQGIQVNFLEVPGQLQPYLGTEPAELSLIHSVPS